MIGVGHVESDIVVPEYHITRFASPHADWFFYAGQLLTMAMTPKRLT